MTKVALDAGACGFRIVVKADKIDNNSFTLRLISPCKMVKDLDSELADLVFSKDVFTRMMDSDVYRLCSKYILHTSCPLPSAMLKALEVEAGLALPRDVTMNLEKE